MLYRNCLLCILLSLTLLSVACGQRGPLYLPEQTAATATPAPTTPEFEDEVHEAEIH